jgi:hypothetical protein
MQLRGKHASSTIERLFSVPSMPRGYEKDKEDGLKQLIFGTPACQDMSLGAEDYYYYYYLNCKWVFTRWQCTTIRHNTQITHITQNNTPDSNKHSTQNYTNNEGHTTHNETTWRGEKFYPYQDSNSGPSAVQPIAIRHTDCATKQNLTDEYHVSKKKTKLRGF